MTDAVLPTSFIKICGVTSVEDAVLIHEAGASALGLIFAPSKRRVTDETAAAILTAMKDDVWCVGVFRSMNDDEILTVVERHGLTRVQLHDGISSSLLEGLRARGVRTVIKALAVSSEEFATFDDSDVDIVLIDGAEPGSGVQPDWTAALSRDFNRPVVVAGGLDDRCVGDVIRRTTPWGVDVASGTEASAGVKDATKVASFVKRASEAFEQEERLS